MNQTDKKLDIENPKIIDTNEKANRVNAIDQNTTETLKTMEDEDDANDMVGFNNVAKK